jgi:hypothetical protein
MSGHDVLIQSEEIRRIVVDECLRVFRQVGDVYGLARALLLEGWALPLTARASSAFARPTTTVA